MRTNSASVAIHDAFAMEFVGKGRDFSKMLAMDFKSSRGYRDMDWRHVDKAEAGLIMKALSSLPEHQQAWAIWCHGPEVPEFLPDQRRFFSWLNDEIGMRLLESERNYRFATCRKIRDVVAYSVMDYRSFVTNGQNKYPVKKIRKECGILQNNWNRDFKHWYDCGWALCDDLDRRVLPLVGGVLQRINQGSD